MLEKIIARLGSLPPIVKIKLFFIVETILKFPARRERNGNISRITQSRACVLE
jgi:hypothetical protein